jgi:sialic acid synthase SpsE
MFSIILKQKNGLEIKTKKIIKPLEDPFILLKMQKKGEKISRENIRRIRPGMGMKPEYFESLLGKKLIRDVKPGEKG